jgi:hypothetical protein
VINQQIKFAGDFELTDVKIGSSRGIIIDVFNFVVDINIFEDIYSPTISGNLTLNDAQDLVNLMPFIGEEKLLLTFKTPAMEDSQGLIEQAFYIYKMTDREYSAERSVKYTLHFVSFEAVRDLNTKLSRGYEGKIHENAENIIKANLGNDKKMNIEETRNTIKFVANNWSPFTTLNFMSKRSISNKHGSANYLFFENTRGYNFVSIDALLEQDSKTRYIYDNNTRDPNGAGGGSTRDIADQLQRIEKYTIKTAFDYLQRVQSGMYKSKLVTHDMITKTYQVQVMDYGKEYEKHNHLNPFPLATAGVPIRSDAFQDTRIRALEGFDNFKSDGLKSWYLRNIMQLSEANAFTMEIQVPGRSDLAVGDIIDVFIYRNTSINSKDQEEDIIDKTFSGRYLVASLCHNLAREKHTLFLTVIKDSLIIDLTKEGTK